MTEIELLKLLDKQIEDLLIEAKDLMYEVEKTWFDDKQNKI